MIFAEVGQVLQPADQHHPGAVGEGGARCPQQGHRGPEAARRDLHRADGGHPHRPAERAAGEYLESYLD